MPDHAASSVVTRWLRDLQLLGRHPIIEMVAGRPVLEMVPIATKCLAFALYLVVRACAHTLVIPSPFHGLSDKPIPKALMRVYVSPSRRDIF